MALLAATVSDTRLDLTTGRLSRVDPTGPDAVVHAVVWIGPPLTEPNLDTRARTLCGQITRVIYPMAYKPDDEPRACRDCTRHADSGTRREVRYPSAPRTAPAICEGGVHDGHRFEAPMYEGKPVPLLKVQAARYRLRHGQRPKPGQRWTYEPDSVR